MPPMRRAMRWAILGAAAVLLLALLVVGVAMLVYPPRYLLRTIAWGDSDVGDIYRFPSRALPASGHPTRFQVAPDMAPARAALQAAMGTADLEAFLQRTGTQALLVLRGDTLLYEGYFNGAARDTLVTSFSVVKSVDSALVGIALAEGKLHSLDDPVTRYLPELARRDPRFEHITLRHLVTMASGIRFAEQHFITGDDARTYYDPNLRAMTLATVRITGPPGERWLYNNYHPLLMGMILERATGMSVTRYLNEKLWGGLGAEYDASFSLDSTEDGFEKMES
ncbi:MAG TPA: serine hydrolase domain-containing protein, partial [bacterium]|nr:serine hydrolase domain-containing protein [bacterium]